MDINKSIRELLLRHSCVVIPGFGGFVASISEAQLDLRKGTITPPRKAILFNKNLINNDGLLIHHLAASNQISYADATEQVNAIVEDWIRELHVGHRISIDQVGAFYFNREQNIQFEQDRFFNLLLSSFGLTAVNFIPESQIIQGKKVAVSIVEKKQASHSIVFEKPLETNVISIVKETSSENPKIIAHPVSRNLTKKIVKYVAAACLLPIVFYSVWIPVKTDVLESGIMFSSDFNPFNKHAKARYHIQALNVKFEQIPNEETIEAQLDRLPEDIATFSYEFAEDFYIPIKLDRHTNEAKPTALAEEKFEETEKIEIPTKIVKPVVESITMNKATVQKIKRNSSGTNTNANYKLIVGSFSSEENASVLVNELKGKGFEAFSISEGAKVRVCATATNSSNEATNLLDTLAKMKYDAWVLSK